MQAETDAPPGDETESTHDASHDGPRPRRGLRWRAAAWVMIGTAVLVLWWPILKGNYYKMSGSPAPADGIPWRTDFDAALEEARATGRPLLVDFTANWCPPCQLMKHETWPDRAVAAAVTDGFIPVLLDVDRPEAAAPATRFGVSALPAVLIIGGDGKVVRNASYLDRRDMVAFLKGNAG